MRPGRLHVALVTLVVLVAAAPWMIEGYYLKLLTKVCILGLFALSLDLLVGVTGLVSLGHAAFFGLAGYAWALMSPEYAAASLPLTFAVALLVAGTASLFVGALALRTKGVFFIMVTLAFAQMFYHLVHDSARFGGSDGIARYVKPEFVLGGLRLLDLENPRTFHLVAVMALALGYVLLATLRAAPFGQVLKGILVNESRMVALGFPVFRYKLAAFVIAGLLAGVAGYLSAVQFGTVNPALLGWHNSGDVLLMVILGGKGTLYGPVLGAFVLVFLRDLLSSLTEHWLLPMGILVIAAVLLLPGGLARQVERLITPRGGPGRDG